MQDSITNWNTHPPMTSATVTVRSYIRARDWQAMQDSITVTYAHEAGKQSRTRDKRGAEPRARLVGAHHRRHRLEL